MNRELVLLTAIGTGILPSCGSSPPSAPSTAPPAVTSFKAFPSSVHLGDTVLLLATFSGASATVDPGGLAARSGAALRVGPITADTTYTLTMAGDGGSASQAPVTVGPDKRTSRISLGYYTGDQSSYSGGSLGTSARDCAARSTVSRRATLRPHEAP